MLAALGDSTEEEEEEEGTEEEDAVVALMARSDTKSDDEPLDSLAQLKEKVCDQVKQNLRNYYSL